MPEPIKVTTVKQIDALELAKLIHEVYGRKFSVLGYFEASNGSVHDVEVPWAWIENDENPSLAEWAAERKPTESQGWQARWNYDDAAGPALGVIIDDLHARGLIEEGEYQLYCWW